MVCRCSAAKGENFAHPMPLDLISPAPRTWTIAIFRPPSNLTIMTTTLPIAIIVSSSFTALKFKAASISYYLIPSHTENVLIVTFKAVSDG
jgi:hypothetical protein